MINKHGGARVGAGRKPGTGSVTKRIPLPLVPHLEALLEQYKCFRELGSSATLPSDNPTKVALPLFDETVRAGFPSPAQGYVARMLDLNEHLISNPAASFFAVAGGVSMVNAGIDDQDLLVVDRSIEALSGHIVIAQVQGEFTVKQLTVGKGKMALHPANPNYSVIPFPQSEDDRIVGVVTWVIKKCMR